MALYISVFSSLETCCLAGKSTPKLGKTSENKQCCARNYFICSKSKPVLWFLTNAQHATAVYPINPLAVQTATKKTINLAIDKQKQCLLGVTNKR